MDYELAKKLKEAGFPQESNSLVAVPTIEELIEACKGEHGQRFRWLKNCKEFWLAQARPEHANSNNHPTSPRMMMPKDFKVQGKTPIEAVANLWIELHKTNL